MRVRCLFAIAILFAGGAAGAASAADVRVWTAGAYKQVVLAAGPAWEASSGHRLIVQTDTAGGLVRRVTGGEAFDLLVAPPAGLAELSRKGLLTDAGTPLAKVGVGVAMREGAPKPDISTVAAFRATLLAARAIAYIDPAAGGSSGIYLTGLLDRLGIADQLRGRSVLVPGGLTAERVADGSAELAIQQVSELAVVPGVVVVGPLPEEVQSYTVYAGAISAKAAEPAAAAAFLAYLGTPAVTAILRQKAMQPPG